MSSFVSAYLIVWLAVTAYVAWLGWRQHELRHKLRILQSGTKPDTGGDEQNSRAA